MFLSLLINEGWATLILVKLVINFNSVGDPVILNLVIALSQFGCKIQFSTSLPFLLLHKQWQLPYSFNARLPDWVVSLIWNYISLSLLKQEITL